MTITRRGLLAGILGACAAPAIVHSPMKLWVPKTLAGYFECDYVASVRGDCILMPRGVAAILSAQLEAAELTACPPLLVGEIGVIDGFRITSMPYRGILLAN